MATNNFKSFGIGAGANVISQADYETLAALLTGFQSGKASSAQINKALRQSSTMAYVLAQFICDSASVDVLDNGTPATILANLKAAMTAVTPGRLINTTIFKASGSFTPRPDTKWIRVKGVGNGANGAGVPATSSSQVADAGGGGGGGFFEAIFTSGFSGTTTVTIGAAAALTTTTANDANACSFGSLISVPGAKGGAGSLQASTVPYHEAGGGVGSLPVITGAAWSIVSQGTSGSNGKVVTTYSSSGFGASSQYGAGGIGYVRAGASTGGGNASGYGAGGGGGAASTSGSAQIGGLATLGIFIVEEYT